jgi:hypothetical protein
MRSDSAEIEAMAVGTAWAAIGIGVTVVIEVR